MEAKTKKTLYKHFFSGTYSEKIDKKSRVHVPLPWRHALKDKAIITKGHDGCLALWTTDFFEYFAKQKVISCATEIEKRIAERLLIGSARTLDIDSKRRIIIPDDLLEIFENESFLYFVGVGDYIEIWTKDLFNSWRESQIVQDAEEN